jgi:sodium/bile acid cotransporter 7
MKILSRNWFLLSLLVAMVCGYLFAPGLQAIEESTWLRQLIVFTVMFAMSLPLESHQIGRVVRHPTAPLLASMLNLGLAPLCAWPLVGLLGSELGPGLIVAAATPSTLASASVMTRRAGGNDAVSLMATLITNGVCFVVTPLWVRLLTASEGITFAVGPIVLELALIVILPMALAQGIRQWPRCAQWSIRHKIQLGVYAQCGVAAMVMFGIASLTLRVSGSAAIDLTLVKIVAAGLAVIGLHLGLLWIGWRLARVCGLSREDQIAVGFSASQKTLMVGLSAALQIGLSVIPLIMYHILQLLIDTVVANRLRTRPRTDEQTIVDSAVG